jgi:hypothetical protein
MSSELIGGGVAMPRRRRKKKESGWLGLAIVAIGVIIGVQMFQTERPRQQQQPAAQMLPEVAAFISSHPVIQRPDGIPEIKLGTATTIRQGVNWEKGKMQIIDFGAGLRLLFYEKDGVVVAVYDLSDSVGHWRFKVWGEYGHAIQAGGDPAADISGCD